MGGHSAGTTTIVGTVVDTRRGWKEAVVHGTASRAVLSLDEVRASGRPAFFLDYDETLLFVDGELFDLQHWGVALQFDVEPVPLPHEILNHGAGIEYGWRHAGDCDCAACTERPLRRASG
jgi:hypothetical protein